MNTKSYAAKSATTPLASFSLERRVPGEHDVQIEILFCGVCHSDVHTVRNEWQGTTYPCVPGHEIVGRVTKVGAKVQKFKAGDIAGVGCLVDSCRTCGSCEEHLEQFCDKGAIFTYNSPDKHSGGVTFGGYSRASLWMKPSCCAFPIIWISQAPPHSSALASRLTPPCVITVSPKVRKWASWVSAASATWA